MNNNYNQEDLMNKVYKNFQTTMIGSLARFEESFGFLWEKDHKDREKFEDLWEDVRNSILNNGNKQARSALDDIAKFFNRSRVKNKYHYKFYFDNQDNRNQEKR